MKAAATADLETLIEETRSTKLAMEKARIAYYNQAVSYDEMVAAAKAFCSAFEQYHKAKFGKAKRLDYRAVLR